MFGLLVDFLFIIFHILKKIKTFFNLINLLGFFSFSFLFALSFDCSRQQFPLGERSDRRFPDRLLQRVVLQDFRIQSGRGEYWYSSHQSFSNNTV